MRPMLAKPATEPFERAVMRAVNDPRIGLDIKMDGSRLLVVVGPRITAYNRDGGRIDVPKPVARALKGLGTSTTLALDGELVDGVYWLFDIADGGHLVNPSSPWQWRRTVLDQLYARWNPDPTLIRVVPWAIDTADKALLARDVIRTGGEGLLAKRIDSPYKPRKRDTERSPHWTKLKHTKDADFVVTRLGVDGKQNMALGLFTPGLDRPMEVGECSALTGDGPRVKVGDVVTVTYLYVGANGRLVQPVTPRLRTDKRPEECGIDQLAPPKARA